MRKLKYKFWAWVRRKLDECVTSEPSDMSITLSSDFWDKRREALNAVSDEPEKIKKGYAN